MSGFMEQRYKTLFVLVKIQEIIGWLLVITIVGIPFGIPMILSAQSILVQVSIEHNTRRSLEVLERIATASGPTGVSRALMGQAETASRPGPAADEKDGCCPSCGSVSEPGERFCGGCGQPR